MTMYRYRLVVFLSVILMALPTTVAAQRVEIDFNDPAGLLGIPGDCAKAIVCSGAPLTFANSYREKGMVFTDSVHPPDRALGPRPWEHYHLLYADASIVVQEGGFKFGRQTPNGFVLLDHPENEKRVLSPHLPGAVIQMIYDPNNDGVPDPFNLISLVVYIGKLNVGTKSPKTGISVYNNLTQGFEWTLIGANNLVRATLEFPLNFGAEGQFVVDKIVFEPASSGASGFATPSQTALASPISAHSPSTEGQATSFNLSSVINAVADAQFLELVDLASPVLASLSIQRADAKGPAQDQFRINGRMRLGPESDGVDVSTEPVVVSIGAFRQMIPAGLFNCRDEGEKKICHFLGPLGGITSMVITTFNREVRFQVIADRLNLTGLDSQKSVSFSLQIKDDLGVTHILSQNLFNNDDEEETESSSIP
jgi:hypothetical protein